MNYTHLNKVFDYYRKNLIPFFNHHQTVISFDEYLKRFSFLPSGKWLRDYECIKLSRIPFLIDPIRFVEKYEEYCVTYNAPVKPEDGIQRVVYQLSPTLHFEAAFWIWIENEEVNAYTSVFVCYHNEREYLKFLDGIYKLRQEGNTEDNKRPVGLAAAAVGFNQVLENLDLTTGGK